MLEILHFRVRKLHQLRVICRYLKFLHRLLCDAVGDRTQVSICLSLPWSSLLDGSS